MSDWVRRIDDVSVDLIEAQGVLDLFGNHSIPESKKSLKKISTELDSLNQHVCEIRDKVNENLREEINSVFIWQEVKNGWLTTLKITFWLFISIFWIKVIFVLIDFAEKSEEIFELTNQEKLETFILDRVEELKNPNSRGFFLRLINKLALRFLNLTRVILIYLIS